MRSESRHDQTTELNRWQRYGWNEDGASGCMGYTMGLAVSTVTRRETRVVRIQKV